MSVPGPASPLAVQLWTEYVQRVSCCMTDPASVTAKDEASLQLLKLSLCRVDMESLTPKQWKQLVLKLKVPFKLGRLLQHGDSLLPGCSVLQMLRKFLPKADCYNFSAQPSTITTGNSNSPAAAIAQQLEQSGLVQQLPQLMASAANQLKARTACSPLHQAAAGGSSQSPVFGDAGGLGPSTQELLLQNATAALHVCVFLVSQQRAGLLKLAASAADALFLATIQLSCALLKDLSTEAQSWDKMSTAGSSTHLLAPAVISAVVAAAFSMLLHLRNCENWTDVFMREEVAAAKGVTPPFLQVVKSPHAIRYIALMFAMLALGTMIHDGAVSKTDHHGHKQTRPSDSQGSSSTSNSSSNFSSNRSKSTITSTGSGSSGNKNCSRGHVHSVASGRRQGGKKTHAHGSCPQHALANAVQHDGVSKGHQKTLDGWSASCDLLSAVPPHYQKLFDELGLDGRVVLWGAVLMQGMFVNSNLDKVFGLGLQMVTSLCIACSGRLKDLSVLFQPAAEQPAEGPSAAAAAEPVLGQQTLRLGRVHVLLLIMLLQHRAYMAKMLEGQSSLSGKMQAALADAYVAFDGCAMSCVQTSLCVLHLEWFTHKLQHEQLQLFSLKWSDARLAAGTVHEAWGDGVPHAEWHDELLPLVLDHGMRLVQKLTPTTQPQASHSSDVKATGVGNPQPSQVPEGSSRNSDSSMLPCSSRRGTLLASTSTSLAGSNSSSHDGQQSLPSSSSHHGRHAGCGVSANSAAAGASAAGFVSVNRDVQSCLEVLESLCRLCRPLHGSRATSVLALMDSTARALAAQSGIAATTTDTDFKAAISEAAEDLLSAVMRLLGHMFGDSTGCSQPPTSAQAFPEDCWQQFHGLLCSVLKLGPVFNTRLGQTESTAYLLQFVLALDIQYGFLLHDTAEVNATACSSSNSCAAGSSYAAVDSKSHKTCCKENSSNSSNSSCTTDVAAACQSGHQGAAAAAGCNHQKAVVPKETPPFLPSLVVIGRCCLHFCKLLEAAMSTIPADPDSLGTSRPTSAFPDAEQNHSPTGNCCSSQCSSQSHHHGGNDHGQNGQYVQIAALLLSETPSMAIQQCMPAGMDGAIPSRRPTGVSVIALILNGAEELLQCADVSTWLSAAGYKPESLQQQLLHHQTAYKAAVHNMTADNLTALMQQLRATGLVLTSIPVPVACNNPWCNNVSGSTELQLVSGRGCLCAECLTARYCSKACQRQHWKQHKPVCKALKEAH